MVLFAACLKFNICFFDIINAYLGCEGTNSCFQINSLRWRYKQLLSKAIPTLEVRIVAFWRHCYAGCTSIGFKSTPCAGSTNRIYLKSPLRWRY